MLIRLNVDIEQLNDDMVMAIFHLYQPSRLQDSTVSIEFLQMLAAEGFSGFNSASSEALWYPLHRASAFGTRQDVDYLLELGASPESCDFYLWTPLFVSIGYSNMDTFCRLEENFRPEYINLQDRAGRTLIQVAVEYGNAEMIASLVRRGCELPPPQARLASRLLGGLFYKSLIIGLQLAGIRISFGSNDMFRPLAFSTLRLCFLPCLPNIGMTVLHDMNVWHNSYMASIIMVFASYWETPMVVLIITLAFLHIYEYIKPRDTRWGSKRTKPQHM